MRGESDLEGVTRVYHRYDKSVITARFPSAYVRKIGYKDLRRQKLMEKSGDHCPIESIQLKKIR